MWKLFRYFEKLFLYIYCFLVCIFIFYLGSFWVKACLLGRLVALSASSSSFFMWQLSLASFCAVIYLKVAFEQACRGASSARGQSIRIIANYQRFTLTFYAFLMTSPFGEPNSLSLSLFLCLFLALLLAQSLVLRFVFLFEFVFHSAYPATKIKEFQLSATCRDDCWSRRATEGKKMGERQGRGDRRLNNIIDIWQTDNASTRLVLHRLPHNHLLLILYHLLLFTLPTQP